VLVLSFCFSPDHHHMHDAVQYNILIPQMRQSAPAVLVRLFLRRAQHHFEGERSNRQVSSLRKSPSRCSVISQLLAGESFMKLAVMLWLLSTCHFEPEL